MALLAKVLVALLLGAAAGQEGGCIDLSEQVGANGCMDGSGSICDEPCFGILSSMSQVCYNETMPTPEGTIVLKDKAAQTVALCEPMDDLDSMGILNKVNTNCGVMACEGPCFRMMEAMTQKCTNETEVFDDAEKLIKDQAVFGLSFCTNPCLSAFHSLFADGDCLPSSNASVTGMWWCAGGCMEKLEFLTQNCTGETFMRDDKNMSVGEYANQTLSYCGPC